VLRQNLFKVKAWVTTAVVIMLFHFAKETLRTVFSHLIISLMWQVTSLFL